MTEKSEENCSVLLLCCTNVVRLDQVILTIIDRKHRTGEVQPNKLQICEETIEKL